MSCVERYGIQYDLTGIQQKQQRTLKSIRFLLKKHNQFLMMMLQEKIFDPDHSEDVDRFILLGLSCSLKVLVVVHCYKDKDNIIRLISARKATRPEEKYYKECLS